MSHIKPETLPLLPLPQGTVLLPGITLRVPVSGRSDIPALLSAAFTQDRHPKPDARNISIGCVPINSPTLRSDGLPWPQEASNDTEPTLGDDSPNPSHVDHRRLFMYGTVAKISGIQGRKADDLALIVEGIRRFRIDRFIQMKPFFKAEVALLVEEHGQYLYFLRKMYLTSESS